MLLITGCLIGISAVVAVSLEATGSAAVLGLLAYVMITKAGG